MELSEDGRSEGFDTSQVCDRVISLFLYFLGSRLPGPACPPLRRDAQPEM